MISTFLQAQFSQGAVVAPEYDKSLAAVSIGRYAQARTKREGRNPAVGARTSRRYGLSMVFSTGIPPLTASDLTPIF